MSKHELQIPDVPGVSLVAYYGKKPLALQQLIIELQQLLEEHFSKSFLAYELEQVHATIIGCEGVKTDSGIINKWFYRLRNEIKYLDSSGLLDYLLNSDLFPLDICFGGYQPNINYQFLSRNKHPSDRSCQLQTSGVNTLIPVMIGWSFKDRIITTDIDRLRRNLQQFNCLHKYHKLPQDIDNDIYLRLGTITGNFTSDLVTNIQQEINNYFQNLLPRKISFCQDNLAIVKYQDLSLPIATTTIYYLSDLNRDLNLRQQLIQQLYI